MIQTIRQFLKLEATAGFLLIATSIVALAIANSPLYSQYFEFFHAPLTIQYRNFQLNKPLLFWINDGLMVIFFFLIGLEIKKECLVGHLSTAAQRMLPGIATLGGVIVPACLYILINLKNPEYRNGWAIPITTDIAFALGALALFGKTISRSNKVFLMTIAVLDDLAAILVIAVFYTNNLSILPLCLAVLVFLVMLFLNYSHINKISIYIILGLILWFLVLQSGVHPTIAGVLTAFTLPLDNVSASSASFSFSSSSSSFPSSSSSAEFEIIKSPLVLTEEALHPWVAYLVLPLFAFANAGVPFSGNLTNIFSNPVMLGIIAGLFLGKQLGVFLASAIAIKTGIAKRPLNFSWIDLYGISILCGIGFTMSLFIGTLAFDDPIVIEFVKLAILIASLASFIYGCCVIFLNMRWRRYTDKLAIFN